jgi:ABC-type lipoprotein export system ATPase subunit
MEMVLSLFAELRRERGLTVVMVTHDPRVAAQADRRLMLVDGKLSPLPETNSNQVSVP